MKEILGKNLTYFFDGVDEDYIQAEITYAGSRCEVWEVSDKLHKEMCNMTEEQFVELAGEDAWWRSSDGSNLGDPDITVYVNGHEMLGWSDEFWEEEFEIHSSNLTTYLCDVVGASQPKNVCACAMDLAKANSMTMGELFSRFEG